MLNESWNQFKHSSNISLVFFYVGWCWMRFHAHPRSWTNILEKNMSVSIKLERLNVRILIRIYCSFGQLFLSFYKMDLESEETLKQIKETIKSDKKKWADDEVRDLTELLEEKLLKFLLLTLNRAILPSPKL